MDVYNNNLGWVPAGAGVGAGVLHGLGVPVGAGVLAGAGAATTSAPAPRVHFTLMLSMPTKKNSFGKAAV